MKSENTSVQFEQKKKFFLVLPLLVLPFMVGFFFLMGGGKGAAESAAQRQTGNRFNTNLPAAHVKDNREANKMSFYEQADRDSASLKERLSSDPYLRRVVSGDGGHGAASVENIQSSIFRQHPELRSAVDQVGDPADFKKKTGVDSNERKVYEKLRQLNESLAVSNSVQNVPIMSNRVSVNAASSGVHDDVDRLEGIARALKESETGQSNAQMQQWNSMLDKIIAIQHPESRDSLQRLSAQNKGKTYPVVPRGREADSVTILEGDGPGQGNILNGGYQLTQTIAFWGLDGRQEGIAAAPNAITAAIDETQTLVTGSDIQMRLTSYLWVDGTLIPPGTSITGTVALSGERLKVQVSSIRYENMIYSVALSVFDVDGDAGIHIPGSISRDVSKESADQAIGGMNLMNMDPSVGGQAATAGIEAAKTLISRKIRLVRVTVKDAYQVFLKDNNN